MSNPDADSALTDSLADGSATPHDPSVSSTQTSPRLVMERLVRREDADRSFDIEFWQRQGDAAIFRAAWDLVVQSYKLKGKDVRELRFQRTVENLQRRPR